LEEDYDEITINGFIGGDVGKFDWERGGRIGLNFLLRTRSIFPGALVKRP